MQAVQTAPRSQMRYAVSRAVNLFLVKRLGIARVPALRFSRAVSIGLSPFAYLPRKRRAESIRTTAASQVHIDPKQAYALPDLSVLPELQPALKTAKALYDEALSRQSMQKYDGGASKKEFLVYATQGPGSAAYPELMKLALARPILDAVSSYLKSVPILNDLAIMVSLPNETDIGSQLYHLDFADERQVKMFICADLVDDACGPFTFVPAPETDKIVETLKYDRGRLTIEQVEGVVGAPAQIAVTGEPGKAVLVDTSRCMHYGSRHNRKPRVMILAQYTDYYVPEQPPAAWPVDRLKGALGLDDVQLLALGA